LSLEDLRAYAIENGEPEVKSGKQEYLENVVNRFI
jgi:xylose isomerase